MPKAAKIVVVAVLVLAGLAVGADRVLAFAAEQTIADKVAAELTARGIESTQSPDVTVEGFPFLTQMIGGEYKAISIETHELRGGEVALTDLHVRAEGVKAEIRGLLNGGGTVTAAQVTGTGLVPYSSIAALAERPGLTVAPEGDKLRLQIPLEIAGRSLTVNLLVGVAVTDGRLQLTLIDAQSGGEALPASIQSLLTSMIRGLSTGLPLPELPFGMSIDQIEVTDTGLRISASAVNVPLSGAAGNMAR